MGKPQVNPRPPEGDFLSADEIIGAIEALSPDDKTNLAEIETIRRRGTEFQQTELIHEALCRALTEKRRCPRGIAFLAFMAMTMRSIADHDRKQRRSTRPIDDGERPSAGRNPNPAAAARSAEDLLAEKEDAAAWQAISRHFEDDPEAQLVLMGWDDELKGAALREATGLSQGQLDYAIRRIRTRMKKLYPKGWQT